MRYTGKKRPANVRLALAAILAVVGIFLIVLRGCGMRFSGFLLIGISNLLLASLLLKILRDRGPVWKWIERGFYALLAVGLICFSVLEIQIIAAGHAKPERAEVMIVLGAGVRGTEPSLALQSRLEAAAAYAKENPAIPLVLSGGQGFGEQISEAECMRRYLVDSGISEERLCLEECSTDTEENFRFSKELLEEQGFHTSDMKIAVVSNDFHLFRAGILAKREGLQITGVGAPIPWLHLEINYTIREAFALVKTYFL